jgi:hypothetical protein
MLLDLHIVRLVEKEVPSSASMDRDISKAFEAPKMVITQVREDLGWFLATINENNEVLGRIEKCKGRRRTYYLAGRIHGQELSFVFFNGSRWNQNHELVVVPNTEKTDAFSSSGNRYSVDVHIHSLKEAADKKRYVSRRDDLNRFCLKYVPRKKRKFVIEGPSMCDMAREIRESEEAKAKLEAMGEES